MKLAAAAVAALFAVFSADAAQAPPNRAIGHHHYVQAWSPDGRELAYVESFDPPRGAGWYEQERVGRDGRGVAPLLRKPPAKEEDWDTAARFSPDGAQVAVRRILGLEDSAIWLANRDGTGLRRLTPDGVDGIEASWAPDGRRLAVVRSPAGTTRGEIWIHDVVAGTARRLTTGFDSGPVWAPDGLSVAFTRGLGSARRALVVGAAGGTPRLLRSVTASVSDWSPDGSRLLLNLGVQGSGVATVRPDGRDLRRLGPGYSGDYSPNGSAILFFRRNRARSDLWLMSASGRSARRLFRLVSGAVWTPDSRSIAFSAQAPCNGHGVFVVPVSNARARRVTNDCRIVGTNGADRLAGTRERDVISGRGGADVITANPGNRPPVHQTWGDADLVDGGAGADRITTGPGADVVRGGPGADRISCGPGRDTVFADRSDRVAADCERVVR